MARITRRHVGPALLVVVALLAAACGGGGGGEAASADGPPYSADQVLDAYEAVGGVRFVEQPDVASSDDIEVYAAPQLDVGSSELDRLNDELGNSAILTQVFVFTGDDPPSGGDAAREAVSYTDLEEGEAGIFEGTNISVLPVENVVITSPPSENGTIEAFGRVIEELAAGETPGDDVDDEGSQGSDESGDGPPYSVEAVLAAFEEVVGQPLEEGAGAEPAPNIEVFVVPSPDLDDTDELQRRNEALGSSATLMRIFIIDSDDKLGPQEAAESVITFTELTPSGDGSFEGTNVRALPVDNVVITGPPGADDSFDRFAEIVADIGG